MQLIYKTKNSGDICVYVYPEYLFDPKHLPVFQKYTPVHRLTILKETNGFPYYIYLDKDAEPEYAEVFKDSEGNSFINYNGEKICLWNFVAYTPKQMAEIGKDIKDVFGGFAEEFLLASFWKYPKAIGIYENWLTYFPDSLMEDWNNSITFCPLNHPQAPDRRYYLCDLCQNIAAGNTEIVSL